MSNNGKKGSGSPRKRATRAAGAMGNKVGYLLGGLAHHGAKAGRAMAKDARRRMEIDKAAGSKPKRSSNRNYR